MKEESYYYNETLWHCTFVYRSNWLFGGQDYVKCFIKSGKPPRHVHALSALPIKQHKNETHVPDEGTPSVKCCLCVADL